LFSIGQRIDDGAGRHRATNPAISGERDSGLSEQSKSRPRYQDLAIYMQPTRKPRFDEAFCVCKAMNIYSSRIVTQALLSCQYQY